jgi:hypothetical protein
MFDIVTLIGLYFLTCISLNSLGVPNYPGDPAPPWKHVDNGSPAPDPAPRVRIANDPMRITSCGCC